MLRRSGMPGFGDGGGDSMELPGAGYGAKKGWSMTTLALGLFALLAVGALLLYGGGGGGSSLSPGEMAERRRSITESGRTLEAELEAVRQSVQHEQHSVEMLQAELSTLQADHHGHKTVVEAMPSSEGHGDAQAQLSACTAATDAVTTKLSEHTAAIAQTTCDSLLLIENMLMKQVDAAIGRVVTPDDFTEYMDFHYTKIFKEQVRGPLPPRPSLAHSEAVALFTRCVCPPLFTHVCGSHMCLALAVRTSAVLLRGEAAGPLSRRHALP